MNTLCANDISYIVFSKCCNDAAILLCAEEPLLLALKNVTMNISSARTKHDISTLSYRELSAFYKRRTPGKPEEFCLIGSLTTANPIFFGHETLLVLNSWTYDYKEDRRIETLQGSHQRHFAVYLPFRLPSFSQIFFGLMSCFDGIRRKSPHQLQALVDAFLVFGPIVYPSNVSPIPAVAYPVYGIQFCFFASHKAKDTVTLSLPFDGFSLDASVAVLLQCSAITASSFSADTTVATSLSTSPTDAPSERISQDGCFPHIPLDITLDPIKDRYHSEEECHGEKRQEAPSACSLFTQADCSHPHNPQTMTNQAKSDDFGATIPTKKISYDTNRAKIAEKNDVSLTCDVTIALQQRISEIEALCERFPHVYLNLHVNFSMEDDFPVDSRTRVPRMETKPVKVSTQPSVVSSIAQFHVYIRIDTPLMNLFLIVYPLNSERLFLSCIWYILLLSQSHSFDIIKRFPVTSMHEFFYYSWKVHQYTQRFARKLRFCLRWAFFRWRRYGKKTLSCCKKILNPSLTSSSVISFLLPQQSTKSETATTAESPHSLLDDETDTKVAGRPSAKFEEKSTQIRLLTKADEMGLPLLSTVCKNLAFYQNIESEEGISLIHSTSCQEKVASTVPSPVFTKSSDGLQPNKMLLTSGENYLSYDVAFPSLCPTTVSENISTYAPPLMSITSSSLPIPTETSNKISSQSNFSSLPLSTLVRTQVSSPLPSLPVSVETERCLLPLQNPELPLSPSFHYLEFVDVSPSASPPPPPPLRLIHRPRWKQGARYLLRVFQRRFASNISSLACRLKAIPSPLSAMLCHRPQQGKTKSKLPQRGTLLTLSSLRCGYCMGFPTVWRNLCISSRNLAYTKRQSMLSWQQFQLKIFLKQRYKDSLYLKRISPILEMKTRSIIAAKRNREQIFYDLRRKPPIDKYDPERIAAAVLTEEGVLLRQIQDLNYYQRQVMYKVCIKQRFQAPISIGFNPIKSKGRSVYSAYRIEQGEFILEYDGDLIDKAEFQRRERNRLRNRDSSSSSTFIFSFKLNGKKWYIDATSEQKNWGAGRLINHSHINPNLGVGSVFVEGRPRLFFYAKREIHPCEELLVDYGEQDSEVLSNPSFAWLRES
ncbi:hypothetical protein IE077_003873 [Cardiosporidium cionae]|uniref:SET domain-containing protein n=1 Tax=Cardiosporidium cionae TaxID=476202 RepID=A0ABQ7J7A1_9APIC|nr:hypothetical protein IE077_003873 [Cardiosporidium cionae]|eukprot:KAF8819867.1 hypothetical protein IE077_003873 [Cardiosporidium cionae]